MEVGQRSSCARWNRTSALSISAREYGVSRGPHRALGVQTHRGVRWAIPAAERAAEHAGRRPLLPFGAPTPGFVLIVPRGRQLAVADRDQVERQPESRLARPVAVRQLLQRGRVGGLQPLAQVREQLLAREARA